MQNTAEKLMENIKENEVISYLQQNPEFFLHQSNLLEKMTLPTTEDGNIASFKDFQNRKLQQKINRLEERNERLIATALQNDASAHKINNLTLELLAATTKEALLNTFHNYMKTEMGLDYSTFTTAEENPAFFAEAKPLFNKSGVRLRTGNEENPCLSAYENVCIRSEALLHITNAENETLGIITLGSVENDRFHEGQGSELLAFLSGVLSYKLTALNI